ncbi:Multiple C2 and transmembrane domain-containing protein 1 [Takifugu flavidus]|uniref:Multiple C2 and transmembrane domain-containing protein 1 n=1 Tax=Takifugu flavidus TaxID=433684 RepID=A0A5C6MYE8_9TELE|nr:Multiple C2 and transmembrane domain-containing protein 1 [Takifugu flavidus]
MGPEARARGAGGPEARARGAGGSCPWGRRLVPVGPEARRLVPVGPEGPEARARGAGGAGGSRPRGRRLVPVGPEGPEARARGAGGSCPWGRRLAPVGPEARARGAGGSCPWGRRLAPVGPLKNEGLFLTLDDPDGINIVGPSNAEVRPPGPTMYQLDIVLKKGNNLAIRDRTVLKCFDSARLRSSFDSPSAVGDVGAHCRMRRAAAAAVWAAARDGTQIQTGMITLQLRVVAERSRNNSNWHQSDHFGIAGVTPTLTGLCSFCPADTAPFNHLLLCSSLVGTSDPYVKFKVAGKEVFRSRTIHKNLNPVWEERASLLVETLRDPLYVKVFDYDFGLQDDFMGSAYLHLESLEHQRTLDVTLDLKDPQYPENDLGTLELAVTLTPKENMSDAYQSMRLSDVHGKAQLWRGIVSISLIEGRRLQPMDANGLSDPYAKFRMGHQKYKSKTIAKTLNPQWREQFDFHLYDEQGGVVDITVWDKDAGKKDDFMGRCTVDLSLLSKEQTHKLELPLEGGEGMLVLLVTLTASAAVSISDLSVNMLDDPHERHQIVQRYVSDTSRSGSSFGSSKTLLI